VLQLVREDRGMQCVQ